MVADAAAAVEVPGAVAAAAAVVAAAAAVVEGDSAIVGSVESSVITAADSAVVGSWDSATIDATVVVEARPHSAVGLDCLGLEELPYSIGHSAKTRRGIENSATWMGRQHRGCCAWQLEKPSMGKIPTAKLKTDYFVACSSIAPNSNQEKSCLQDPSFQSRLPAKAWLS